MKRKNLTDAFVQDSNLLNIESALTAIKTVDAADAKLVLRDNENSSDELQTLFIPAEDVPTMLEYLEQVYRKRLSRLGVDL